MKSARPDGLGTDAAAMTEHSDTLLRVRYAETDQMGYVYYGNYYTYFEVGRVEYMRARGVAYKDMEIDDDSFIVVAESQCRYRRPARYDDLLRIRTRVSELRRRTIRFSYEVLREETGELLASGDTLHVICDCQGRPKALPDKYRRYFEAEPAGPSVAPNAPARRRKSPR